MIKKFKKILKELKLARKGLSWTEDQTDDQKRGGVESTYAKFTDDLDLVITCSGRTIDIDTLNVQSFIDWLNKCSEKKDGTINSDS